MADTFPIRWSPSPSGRYRLRDGTIGNEYQAVLECIKFWEAKKQETEDRLEEFRRRLVTAEGHP